jgi:hypothetical protein
VIIKRLHEADRWPSINLAGAARMVGGSLKRSTQMFGRVPMEAHSLFVVIDASGIKDRCKCALRQGGDDRIGIFAIQQHGGCGIDPVPGVEDIADLPAQAMANSTVLVHSSEPAAVGFVVSRACVCGLRAEPRHAMLRHLIGEIESRVCLSCFVIDGDCQQLRQALDLANDDGTNGLSCCFVKQDRFLLVRCFDELGAVGCFWIPPEPLPRPPAFHGFRFQSANELGRRLGARVGWVWKVFQQSHGRNILHICIVVDMPHLNHPKDGAEFVGVVVLQEPAKMPRKRVQGQLQGKFALLPRFCRHSVRNSVQAGRNDGQAMSKGQDMVSRVQSLCLPPLAI